MVGFLEILFTCLLPSVVWAIHLEQVPVSITKEPRVSSSAEFTCKVSGGSGSTYIHWYRVPAGEAPQRLLYLSYSKPQSWDAGFSSEKVTAYFQDRSICKLSLHKLENADSGHYYCAAWAYTSGWIKYFGTGTKLVVSDIPAKLDSTKIQALPPSTEQDGKVSYMCLIQDFYPNVIKVTWEDEKKNAEKNAVHEEIWSPGNNQQSYSLSSWLTVDKNSNKNYRCKYQHEIKEDYVPMESPADTFSDTTVIPQTTTSCTKFAENNTTLSTDIMDSYIHRTAYFIYIVLLLKSTMYYVIVLFFICRMQSPIKHQGKKP